MQTVGCRGCDRITSREAEEAEVVIESPAESENKRIGGGCICRAEMQKKMYIKWVCC